MDSHNLFLTRTTYRLLRAEYAVALIGSIVLAVTHLGAVRWPAFVGLFVYIDLIGYLPGAIAYRRSQGRPIPRGYYLLYNSMHSLLTAATVAGLWCLLVGPEWALLALPIHLCGDRAIFGNFLKPFGVSFEPVAHPAYQELVKNYGHHSAQPTSEESAADDLESAAA
ncbi:MAG: hypothetical protein QOG22_403 [Pseudonocardiales bacterium]|nr:hypothetical protein [Pseudonocardiales bacterium]